MKIKVVAKTAGWTLKDGVSQSLLGTWLTCREKAKLTYQDLWTSQQTSNAITFGSLFHSSLEGFYKTGKYDIKTLLQKTKKETEEQRIWTIEDEENKVLNEGYLRILVPAYLEHYKEIDKGKKWFAIEKEFKNEWNGLTFRGKYDRAYKANGETWLLDTKTKSRLDPNIQDRLGFDLQIMFYVFNYWLEFKTIPTGFIYDQIKRPALRKGSQETLKHFMERVKEDVDKEYFSRIRIPMTKTILEEWVKNQFSPMIAEFNSWAKGLVPGYRNPTACMSAWGACQFVRVCGSKDFSGLFQRKKVFSELEATA